MLSKISCVSYFQIINNDMKKIIFFLSSFLIVIIAVHAQQTSKKTISVCLSEGEMKLYKLVMEYRKANGLPAIPLSASLSYVAQTHCKDVDANKPTNSTCNLHSWSSKGSWTGCCYTPDHAQANCMWNKPKELTNYEGSGFEIAFTVSHSDNANYTATPEEALAGWKSSQGHNDVVLNKSIWKNQTWKSIGVGIYKGFACIWFGRESDVESTPVVCK